MYRSYPSRMNKRWSDDEKQQLLNLIKDGAEEAIIAVAHQRTVNAIHAMKQQLAADFHYIDCRPTKQIMRFTGLSQASVERAIEKHRAKHTGEYKKKDACIGCKVSTKDACVGTDLLDDTYKFAAADVKHIRNELEGLRELMMLVLSTNLRVIQKS